VALLSVPLFGESLSALQAAGVALIAAGVLIIEVGAHA
jgi:multidrug transporter EmrE-like cation transporter